jgi:hypothetical protein
LTPAAGGTITLFSASGSNQGTLEANGGNLTVDGLGSTAWANTGTLSAAAGSTLSLSGTWNSTPLSVGAGGEWGTFFLCHSSNRLFLPSSPAIRSTTSWMLIAVRKKAIFAV